MSEWLKEHAWKACVRVTVPRVRIPLSPVAPRRGGQYNCFIFKKLRLSRPARRGGLVGLLNGDGCSASGGARPFGWSPKSGPPSSGNYRETPSDSCALSAPACSRDGSGYEVARPPIGLQVSCCLFSSPYLPRSTLKWSVHTSQQFFSASSLKRLYRPKLFTLQYPEGMVVITPDLAGARIDRAMALKAAILQPSADFFFVLGRIDQGDQQPSLFAQSAMELCPAGRGLFPGPA